MHPTNPQVRAFSLEVVSCCEADRRDAQHRKAGNLERRLWKQPTLFALGLLLLFASSPSSFALSRDWW